jgi:hypothetical protein
VLDSTASFFHDLSDPRIEAAPGDIAQLVEHILKKTEAPFHYGRDLQRIYAKLKDYGVPDSTLHAIAEAAMGLEIELE